MSKEEFKQRWARKSLREMLSAVEECVGHSEGFEGENNGHDDGFEHKNRGARGRASLVPNNHGEKSVKCSTQLRGCPKAERVCGDKVCMQYG
ncbi:hypothetical protein Gotur_028697 [Gossypium turneri]